MDLFTNYHNHYPLLSTHTHTQTRTQHLKKKILYKDRGTFMPKATLSRLARAVKHSLPINNMSFHGYSFLWIVADGVCLFPPRVSLLTPWMLSGHLPSAAESALWSIESLCWPFPVIFSSLELLVYNPSSS